MQEYNILNLYGWLCLFILMGSCSEQNTAIQNQTEAKGESVFGLDHKTWHIYQDQKDNYWFGSNGNGVFHYDGKKLIQFTQKDGVVDNAIRGIQGDHLGNVFIETPKGVSKYDGNTFATLQPIIAASNEWKLEPTDLWFNCNGNPNEVYRYDGDNLFELTLPRQKLKETFGTEAQGLSFSGMNSSPYSVFGIDKDKAGNLWIGTIVAGAFRYDGNAFLWVGEKELSTLPDGRVPGVRSMLEDKEGNMWLSNFISKYKLTDNGSTYEKLVGIDPANELLQDQLPYFNSGLSDQEGNLWMTTYGGGVWKYDGEELLNFPVINGVTEALLVSIYQDNQGVLWLGTDNVGVFRYNGETFEKFEPMRK